MWNRSFRARLPSKSESGRCENEAFVRDLPQKVKVANVKTKLSCETFKFWKFKFKLSKWRLNCTVPPRGRSEHDPTLTESVPHPPAGQASPPIFRGTFVPQNKAFRASAISQKTYFVRGFPKKLKAEDVKTKLSCETSLKKWKWKMWKRSFRARSPWKSESGRCENEASCETSLKKWNWSWKMWKWSLRAGLPWKSESEDVKTKLSCESFLKNRKLKMWKRSFRARHPSKSESGRCENEAFVRRLPFQNSFNSISFNSFNSFNSFLRSFILGHHRFNSIQFKSFNSIRSFNLWFLAIINIRNTEVPSNFLWWGRESARQECLNGWLIELCKRWMISCMGKSLSHKWVICYQMIANDSDRLIKWLNDT